MAAGSSTVSHHPRVRYWRRDIDLHLDPSCAGQETDNSGSIGSPVGDHLSSGRDNPDLALAIIWTQRLLGKDRLEPRQWGQLIPLCRRWKEIMLGDAAPEELTVHLPGTGGRLIGGGKQLRLTRSEVEEVLVEGFFPRVPLTAEPARWPPAFFGSSACLMLRTPLLRDIWLPSCAPIVIWWKIVNIR